jgi:very-short-patch-repair endonuclease
MKKLTPNYDDGMWKGAPVSSFLKAKELRKNETEAEKTLWEKLRNNQIKGLKFRRQHPINLYIADFYCHKLRLIIEIDGEYHNLKEQVLNDLERTEELTRMGLDVMRLKNDEVLNNIDSVLLKIINWAEKIENPNCPNPKGS